jgi:hypothetical protein
MSKAMKNWWRDAHKKDKEKLAKLAKTTVAQLGQIAGGHRQTSPVSAKRIEIATSVIANTTALPIVLRSDLCKACGDCEYAKRCEGAKK